MKKAEEGSISRTQLDACQDAGIWPMANSRKGKAPRVQWEQAEQESLFVVVNAKHPDWRFSHWPNERQERKEAWKMARAGVCRGMPDNWLFHPCQEQGFTFAVSELKRPGAPPSSVTPDQRAWLDTLAVCGACVGVHRGWESALAFFEAYMAGEGEHGERWWVT